MASFIKVVVRAAALGAALGSITVSAPRSAAASEGGAPSAASLRIRRFLDASGSPQPLCSMPGGSEIWTLLQSFYGARAHQPAWTHEGALNPAGRILADTLRAAAADGLDPARYDP